MAAGMAGQGGSWASMWAGTGISPAEVKSSSKTAFLSSALNEYCFSCHRAPQNPAGSPLPTPSPAFPTSSLDSPPKSRAANTSRAGQFLRWLPLVSETPIPARPPDACGSGPPTSPRLRSSPIQAGPSPTHHRPGPARLPPGLHPRCTRARCAVPGAGRHYSRPRSGGAHRLLAE